MQAFTTEVPRLDPARGDAAPSDADLALAEWLRAEIARLLAVEPHSIANDTPLLELGLDSLAAVRLCGAISARLGFDVDPMVVFDYSTISELVAHLNGPRAPSASISP